MSDRVARGARVVFLEAAGPELAGRTALVLGDVTSADGVVLAAASLDERTDAVAVIPHEHLRPVETERLCLSGDPRCGLLEPCDACVLILRSHLKLSLESAGFGGEAGKAFVTAWNGTRKTERERIRETLAQAKTFVSPAVSESITTAVDVAVPLPDLSFIPEVVDAALPHANGHANGSVETVAVSPDSAAVPQIVHTHVEKKVSTRKKTTRRKVRSEATADEARGGKDAHGPAAASGDGAPSVEAVDLGESRQ
jgi:hypothetical protein